MKCFKYVKGGGFVVTADPAANIVHFVPLGGGTEYSARHDDFHRLVVPAPDAAMKRGTVTAEFLPDGVALPCWADGAGKAWFDRATVERIRELGIGPLEWAGEMIMSRMENDPCECDTYRPQIAPDGSQVWSLGKGAALSSGGWAWDRVEF
jgi:hypothetical protein